MLAILLAKQILSIWSVAVSPRCQKRYMSSSVHFSWRRRKGESVLRILSTLDAKYLLQSVTKFLNQYGINLDEDIVGVTSDGAPVMAKFGTLFKAQQQLCYAHAIQLAVVKVLYKF